LRKLKDLTDKNKLDDKKYNKPNITINKVYTKVGDKGFTYLVGGHKIKKNSLRIKVFGDIDQLNVLIGSCCVAVNGLSRVKADSWGKVFELLLNIQQDLFNLGNMIATLSSDFNKNMPQINKNNIKVIENSIDLYNKNLPTLKSFVLPGGNELNIRFHQARTFCRHVERMAVNLDDCEKIDNIILSYLNRLSDLLFVLARWSNIFLKQKEVLWNPHYDK